MRLVLLGPPGAGKGTQAEKLAADYGLPHISTGDILREEVREGSDVGREAKSHMDKGALVPDAIVTRIVVKRLEKEDAGKGFILDGYPRTRTQAESLTGALRRSGIQIDKVLYFKTSVPTVISRLSGRRVCEKCGAIYHVRNNPPVKEGVCDKCAGGLKQRPDDKEETVRKRLEVYEKTSGDLLDYYRNRGLLTEVDGDEEAASLYRSLQSMFEKEGLV